MKVKIRKGDQVEVISGRSEDKGKRGEVIKSPPQRRACCGAGRQYAHKTSTRSAVPGAYHHPRQSAL